MHRIDPVCGSRIASQGRPTREHAGRVYVFCGEECRLRFVAEPQRWTGARYLPDEILRETEALIHRWFG